MVLDQLVHISFERGSGERAARHVARDVELVDFLAHHQSGQRVIEVASQFGGDAVGIAVQGHRGGRDDIALHADFDVRNVCSTGVGIGNIVFISSVRHNGGNSGFGFVITRFVVRCCEGGIGQNGGGRGDWGRIRRAARRGIYRRRNGRSCRIYGNRSSPLRLNRCARRLGRSIGGILWNYL